MKLRIKKFNSAGVAHHALIAILVISGFAGFGAWRVFSSSANAQFSMKNSEGCFPGKRKPAGQNCQLYNDVAKIKAECSDFKLQFDAGRCQEACISGYFIKEGACKQLAEASKLPECQAKHLEYDKATNKCVDKCVSGFHKEAGNCVKDATGGGSGSTLETDYSAEKKACADKFRVWNNDNKQCSERCVAKYSKVDGKLPCKLDVVVTDQCAQDAARCAATGGVAPEEDSSSEDTDGNGVPDTETTPVPEGEENGDGSTNAGGCLEGRQAAADGTCPEDVVIDTPVIEPAINTLDNKISKENCELMGREWESNAKLQSDKKKKVSGCKVDVCIKKESKLVSQTNGKPFCKGFVQKIEKSKCDELHRKWLDQVLGCAVRYNQNPKPGATVVKAKECTGSYTSYVYKSGADECLTPNTVQRLRGIAKSTGTPFVKLTNMSQAGICKVRSGVHWNGKRCVKDAPAQTGVSPQGDGGVEPTGSTTVDCSKLGRPQDGPSNCKRSCLNSQYVLTNYSGNQWDKCIPNQAGNCVASNSCPPGVGDNPTGLIHCIDYVFEYKYASSASYHCGILFDSDSSDPYQNGSYCDKDGTRVKISYLEKQTVNGKVYTYACSR